jgi:hypothetical protein
LKFFSFVIGMGRIDCVEDVFREIERLGKAYKRCKYYANKVSC